jgi:hypothetical protein
MASSSCCFYIFLMLFLLYQCSVIQNAGSKARRNVGTVSMQFSGLCIWLS